MGGLESNKHASKKLHAGLGTADKTPVMGAKDLEIRKVKTQGVESVNRETLRNFLAEVASSDERPYIYRDEASVYDGPVDIEHETVKHLVGESVRGRAHTNGIASLGRCRSGGFVGRVTRCR